MYQDFYSGAYPLFVYGSLRRDFGHPMSAYLWKRATFVGSVYLPGRLYHLGDYPGFVPDPATEHRVFGHLALLDERWAETTWRALDSYEGIDLPDPEYDRLLLDFDPSVGGYTKIWLYRYRLSVTEMRWIESGDFKPDG